MMVVVVPIMAGVAVGMVVMVIVAIPGVAHDLHRPTPDMGVMPGRGRRGADNDVWAVNRNPRAMNHDHRGRAGGWDGDQNGCVGDAGCIGDGRGAGMRDPVRGGVGANQRANAGAGDRAYEGALSCAMAIVLADGGTGDTADKGSGERARGGIVGDSGLEMFGLHGERHRNREGDD